MTIDEYNAAIDPLQGEAEVVIWVASHNTARPHPIVVRTPRTLDPSVPLAHQTITFTTGTGPTFVRLPDIVHISKK